MNPQWLNRFLNDSRTYLGIVASHAAKRPPKLLADNIAQSLNRLASGVGKAHAPAGAYP